MATPSAAAANREKGEAKISTHGLNTDFAVGETALCYEPDQTKAKMLYEAKILEIDVTKDEKGKKVPEFFIHFMGWNKSWDRWVLSESVLKLSDHNKALQTKLYKQAVGSKKKRKQQRDRRDRRDQPEDGSLDSVSRTSQSSVNSSQAETEDSRDLPLVTINLPNVLKTKLEDDCYYIKRRKKLLKLPRFPCALKILNDFWDYCQEKENGKIESGNSQKSDNNLYIIKELVCGLQTYLNFTLSSMLLYNFEKEQYEALFPPSQHSKPAKEANASNEANAEEHLNHGSTTAPECSKAAAPKRKYNRIRVPAADRVSRSQVSNSSNSSSASIGVASLDITQPEQDNDPTQQKNVCQPVDDDALVEKEDLEMELDIAASEQGMETEESGVRLEEDVATAADNLESQETEQCLEESLKEFTCKESDIQKEDTNVVNTEAEQSKEVNEESEEKPRTLRPRRSIVPVKRLRLDEKEAKNEQASLPVGATAKSFGTPGKKSKELSIKENQDLRDTSFVPYPLSACKSLSPAEIYGAEHLLRLFVKLPALLSRTDLEQRKLDLLVDHLDKFLRFMADRAHLWFSSDNYSQSIL